MVNTYLMLSMGTSTQFIIYKLRLVAIFHHPAFRFDVLTQIMRLFAIFHHPAFRFDVLTQITSPIEDCVWWATLIYSAPITHV